MIADRFPKRKLLYFTQSAFGVLALILGVLVATNTVQLWMIYILASCLGLVTAIDNPVRQVFIGDMVGKDQLVNAVSLNSTQFNLARVIGPAIGGGLIATVGLAPCFIINAVSYIAVLIALFMMREKDLHYAPLIEKTKGQLMEGFRYIKSNPVLLDTLLMMVLIGTLSYEFAVSIPLLAQFTFHSGATGYAWLTSAMGIGAAIGGLYTASRRKRNQTMLVIAALLFGISMIICSVAPSLVWAFIAMILVGAFSINFTSLGNTTLQLESAPEMRGRVMSLWAVTFLGSTPIGGPIIGYIGQHAGPRWSLAVGGLAAILAAAIGALAIKETLKQKK